MFDVPITRPPKVLGVIVDDDHSHPGHHVAPPVVGDVGLPVEIRVRHSGYIDESRFNA